MKIGILAATHSLAQRTVEKLSNQHQLVLFGRNRDRLQNIYPKGECRICDLETEDLKTQSEGCDLLVSFAHARYTESILKNKNASVKKIVATGSTWKFTQYPNPAADEVRRAEKLLMENSIDCVMVHPSMIYGIEEEKTISKLMDWIDKRRWLPLSGGGKNLVQPAFVEDIVDTFVAAIENEDVKNKSFVVASHQPLTYRDLAMECARLRNKPLSIINMPFNLMYYSAKLMNKTLNIKFVTSEQILRLVEDKNFDVSEGEELIGRPFHQFSEGLEKILVDLNRSQM